MLSSNKTIQEEISKLGFRETESKVLLAMFKIGNSSVTNIANHLGMARQTAYYILKSLLNEKLVHESRKGEKKLYFTSIEMLFDYFKKQEDQSKKARKSLAQIRVHLKGDKITKSLPAVQYYQGKIGLTHLLKDIVDTARKYNRKDFRTYALSKFYPGMEDVFSKFIQERDKLGVKSKVIVPINTDYKDILGYNTYKREFRKVNIEDNGAALYLIGDKVYLFSYKEGAGVMIENRTLSNFLVSIFENHWSFLSQNKD